MLPLVDLSRGDNIVHSLESACRDVGFMYLTGHGIAPQTISRLRAALIEYFALPAAVKLADRISRDNYRGYIPPRFFSANTGALKADEYEGYKLHYETADDDPVRAKCDLYGTNKWPRQPADLKEAVLGYWRECDRLTAKLLTAMAKILGADEARFLRFFDSPLTNMTLLHYPPQAPGTDGFGIHPHKDTDVFTILAPDPVGGLFVKCRSSQEWINVEAPGDALVVNIGDLMELWSGGYFVSTPHKVVNLSGAERYSFPYFVVPRFDTVVKPLRPLVPGFDRDSVHVGDVSREVWRTNWPDALPQNAGFDLGTMSN
jgi:isopenicillin N synthase-like dioxygenase